MRHASRAVTFAVTFTVTFAAGVASAQETDPNKKAIAAARAELDAIEESAAALKKGEGAKGNDLLKKTSATLSKLFASKDKSVPEWAAAVRKAHGLEASIWETATGKPLPPIVADETTKKAVAALDRVEKDQTSQPAGDSAAASGLVLGINEARTLLGKSPSQARRANEWIDSAARADVLDHKVRARAAEAASSEKPAPTPAPGGPVELKVGDRPPPTATKLAGQDSYVLRRDFYPVYDDYVKKLETVEPTALADDFLAKRYRDAAARMEAAFTRVAEADHPDVAWGKAHVAEFRKRVEVTIEKAKKLHKEEVAAANAEAKTVDGRLAELGGFFDPEKFSCELAPPFTAERVRAWVADLKKWDATGKKGLAEVDKVAAEHPAYAKDARLTRLQYWFSKALGERLQSGIEKTTGALASRQSAVKFLLEPGGVTEERLASDPWVADNTKALTEALEAVEARLIFSKEFLGKEDAEAAAAVSPIKEAQKKVEAGATRVLAAARMPESRSTDPELLEAAKAALEHAKYGPFERMAVNADKTHHVEKRKDSYVEGEYIVIRTWTDEYDTFQVACAEKVDGVHRIVYYSLKYFERTKPDSPLGRWFCSGRIVSQRILQENIAK